MVINTNVKGEVMGNSIKRKTVVKFLLCVIWLGIIFYNGTRQGEISQRSSKQVIKVVSMFINIPSSTSEGLSIKFSDANYFVRKNAHFFQYLILSILLCAAVRRFRLKRSSEILLLLFLILLFPVIDEFIQKFIPGRTSSTFDIIIDFMGGILGILISNVWYRRGNNRNGLFVNKCNKLENESLLK
jgi:VanZ family protein